jgi:hypothetical protein
MNTIYKKLIFTLTAIAPLVTTQAMEVPSKKSYMDRLKTVTKNAIDTTVEAVSTHPKTTALVAVGGLATAAIAAKVYNAYSKPAPQVSLSKTSIDEAWLKNLFAFVDALPTPRSSEEAAIRESVITSVMNDKNPKIMLDSEEFMKNLSEENKQSVEFICALHMSHQK